MDAKELKYHLADIAKREGKHVLTQNEIDFMEGRISYNTYQQRCYSEYCQGNLTRKPKSQR